MRMIWAIMILGLLACESAQVPTPRPHQFPRLDLPDRGYKIYEGEDCPFTIEVPQVAEVIKKEYLFGEIEASPCWFDVAVTPLNATIHCSYYKIDKDQRLDKLVDDAYTMASKHNQKASFREEYEIKTKEASGMIFKINGPVATPYQFYVTDSVRHFFRGSLYFDKKVDADSIAPVITYIEDDVDYMLRSLSWQ